MASNKELRESPLKTTKTTKGNLPKLLSIIIVLCIVIFCLTCLLIITTYSYQGNKTKRAKIQHRVAPGSLPTPEMEKNYCLSKECRDASTDFLLSMNRKQDPCDDFYEYVCGFWPLLHPRGTYSYLTRHFWTAEKTIEFLREFINGQTDKETNDETRLVKSVYDTCMNSPTDNETDGVNQLRRMVFDLFFKNSSGRLENASFLVSEYNFQDLQPLDRILARSWKEYGADFLLQLNVVPFKAAGIVYSKPQLSQAILALSPPAIEPHWPSNIDNLTMRLPEKLEQYFRKMKFVFSFVAPDQSIKNITAICKRILGVEASLVKVLRILPSKRVIIKEKEFKKLNGVIQWAKFFTHLSPNVTQISVKQLAYLIRLDQILKRIPRPAVYLYFQWKFMENRLRILPPIPVQRRTKKLSRREEFCLKHITGTKTKMLLGFVAAKILIRGIGLNNENDHYLREMAASLKEKFDVLLSENEWMDETTKKNARRKLKLMIGCVMDENYINSKSNYYDPLFTLVDNYTDLRIKEDDSLITIVSKIEALTVQRRLAWLDQPLRMPDRIEIFSSPAIGRAFYSAVVNSIAISTARLFPPLYFHLAPMVINMGLTGSTYGHEMTHGFDTSGSEYDGYGTMLNWWTLNSTKEFHERTKCLIEQYNKFCFKVGHDKLCVDGAKTLNENIADNGGVRIGFAAYKQWAENNSNLVLPTLENFTLDQLYFISFGSLWCSNTPEKQLREILKTDVHTVNKYRVIGTLQNFEEFSKAFKCPIGSKMNPQHKCRVW